LFHVHFKGASSDQEAGRLARVTAANEQKAQLLSQFNNEKGERCENKKSCNIHIKSKEK